MAARRRIGCLMLRAALCVAVLGVSCGSLRETAIETSRAVVAEQAPVLAGAVQEAAAAIVQDQGPILGAQIQRAIEEGIRRGFEAQLPVLEATARRVSEHAGSVLQANTDHAIDQAQDALRRLQWGFLGAICVCAFLYWRWRRANRVISVCARGVEHAPTEAKEALKAAISAAGGKAPEIFAAIQRGLAAAVATEGGSKNGKP